MKQVFLESQALTPSKIVCVGRNYVEHIRELENELPTSPVIFMKPNSAIAADIHAAREGELHYEGEIAFLIRDGLPAAVGFGLDLTRRDLQAELKRKGLPWERAKAFDGSAVFSRFVAISCPLSALSLELHINGKRVQHGGYAQMIYKPEALLEDIRSFATLEDDDILMTGTPKGVGSFVAGDVFHCRVSAGDRVLVEQTWTAR